MRLDLKKNLGFTDRIVRTGILLLLITLIYNRKFSSRQRSILITFSLLNIIETSYSY